MIHPNHYPEQPRITQSMRVRYALILMRKHLELFTVPAVCAMYGLTRKELDELRNDAENGELASEKTE